MIQDGQFITMTISEFKEWLYKQKINRKITRIQQHHTYSPNYANFYSKPDEIYWMKSMEAAHLNRGFQTIAQHFSTFSNGNICVGRSLELDPAGILGANSNAICIENVINGDAEIMTEAHKNTIIQLTAILCDYFNLEPNTDTIIYHSWFNLNTGVRDNEDGGVGDGYHKSCPSTKFFGGNSVTACRNNFIPLVKQAMNGEIKGSEDNMINMDSCFISKKIVNTTLNIRELPNADTNTKVLGQFKQGDIFISTGNIGDWLRLPYNGRDCFVSGKYCADYTEPDYKVEIDTLKLSIEDLNKLNTGLKEKITNAIGVLR